MPEINQQTKVKVRVINGDFWCVDDVVDITTLSQALIDAKDFLESCEEAGLDYCQEDIQIVAEDDSFILTFEEAEQLLIKSN